MLMQLFLAVKNSHIVIIKVQNIKKLLLGAKIKLLFASSPDILNPLKVSILLGVSIKNLPKNGPFVFFT